MPKESSVSLSRLKECLRYVRNICLLGASNRGLDVEKTKGWIWVLKMLPYFQYERNEGQKLKRQELKTNYIESFLSKSDYKPHQWILRKQASPLLSDFLPITELDPLFDKALNIDESVAEVLMTAMAAKYLRFGNCGVQASLVVKYLWEHAENIQRIEYITMNGFDHGLVIINREEKSLQDKPDTWGAGCYCIDTWYEDGLIFKGVDFIETISKIHDFVMRQPELLSEMGFRIKPVESSTDVSFTVRCEVNPGITAYPSYDPHKTVDDY